MNKRQTRQRLREIKSTLSVYLDAKRKAADKLENLFGQLIDELNDDHDKIVDMVKAAKYELLVKQSEEENENEPGLDIDSDEEDLD